MKRRDRGGFTLVEVLVMAAVVAILVLVILPRPAGVRTDGRRIKCVNNLKNVGLAFRIFATDNGDRFPAEVMLTNGVALKSMDALRVYLTLTNELSTPKILSCPADENRNGAESFTNVLLKNISYFVSLSGGATMPQMFLAGDRNLQTNGVQVPTGIFRLTEAMPLSWTMEMHHGEGNIAMGDGSVQHFSSTRLKQGVKDQGLGTAKNYLAVP
jgi:type II secretory pathway pseudopilin PulG